jgi:hypothetical protein
MSTDRAASGASAASTDVSKAPPESLSQSELRLRAAFARQEVASTLDAIEYKLNVPRQYRAVTTRVDGELRRLGRDKPLALVGVAAGAAAAVGSAVGGIVWAVARVIRRLDDRRAR